MDKGPLAMVQIELGVFSKRSCVGSLVSLVVKVRGGRTLRRCQHAGRG